MLDLYTWDGPAWSNPSTFASGGVDNRLPSVAYDAAGIARIIWFRGGNLVHATASAPTPQIVRGNSTSQSFYGAHFLTNSQGNLTVLREETAGDGPANIFATMFDPFSQTWSEDRQLNTDSTMVHDLTGFLGRDGRQRSCPCRCAVELVDCPAIGLVGIYVKEASGALSRGS